MPLSFSGNQKQQDCSSSGSEGGEYPSRALPSEPPTLQYASVHQHESEKNDDDIVLTLIYLRNHT